MRSQFCERRIWECNGAPVCLAIRGCFSIGRVSSFFVMAGLLTGALIAQSSSNLDCSDPLLTGTLECSNLNSNQTQRGTQLQMPPGAAGAYSAIPENPSANPTGMPPSNYSDVEQLSRQASRQQPPLPPEPLTEFQKFAASTTGQILPIYGAELFRRIPSTFAPVDMAPVPSDYVIGPGDELRIRIWGQVNQQANVRVDRSGEIYLPQVGPVHVAGLASSDLDAHLREAVGRVYRNFDLNADVGQIRAIQVYVTGEARRPGVYTVSSLSTLVDALFSSGGPSVEGSLRSIELRRGSAVITRFDLYDLLIRGDRTKDAKLLSGDVIFIPPVGPETAVFGSVRNPAIYELRPQEPLADALADAGGVSAVAAEARVSIERIDDHRERHAMEVGYAPSDLAIPLAEGDLVRVFSMVPKYDKTVTLRGNIADPGRFAWHEGMRVSDLIPDKESLLTRNYWWRRTQMGLPAPEFEPLENLANRRQPIDNQPVSVDLLSAESRNGQSQSGSAQNSGASAQNQSGSAQSQDLNAQGQSELGQGSELNAGEQSVFGQDPNLSAQQRAGSAPLAGTQAAVASRAFPPSQRTEVRLPAPEIDWDYAVIERLDPETLKTELLSFDLGKLVLQHDATQDLELRPDDVISIFSEADIHVPVAEQTKLVRLEGEFAHAGVYSVHPGETLRQIVERAGGLTPNAYLYGSEFTRESARAVQQARIDEYVQSLSMQVQRSTVALATSPAVAAQSLASGSAAQNSVQNILTSLRQIRATGRIVLQVNPDATGVGSLPDIALEDGDRFSVPHTPAIVNVVGAVYDQNSFLFKTDSRAGTYLRLAGGLNKDADRRREFIIRADGDVVSYDMSNGAWGSEFNDRHIYPGDTIVVPEKIFKPSAMYGVMNWSQLFSQFALGAAALDVIR
jgi:protein involved in polysaccharide export with SLBB domain